MNFEVKMQENYERFLEDILRKIPVLYTKQLDNCLQYSFEISGDESRMALNSAQKHGVLLMTADGYSLSKGMYSYLTSADGMKDQYFDGLDYSKDYPLQSIAPFKRYIDKELIDLMWIVTDKMPESYNFIVTSGVWRINFVAPNPVDGTPCLYQIADFPKQKEDLNIGLLHYSENTKELKEWLENNQNSLKRIAVLHDESRAGKFKNLEFDGLTLIDSSEYCGYRVLDEDDEDEDGEE